MLIGCHISIAGGFEKSLTRIIERGGDCLMTFASSPRSLSFAHVSPDSIHKYNLLKPLTKIKAHFFHGVYLVNLAHSSPDYVLASISSLISYQQLSHHISGSGTIFHIGSHQGRGFASVKTSIANSVLKILEQSGSLPLFLENSAGPTIGSFSELAQLLQLIAQLNPHFAPQAKVCLDTQHAFAAGIPIDQVLEQFDHTIGLSHLGVVHLNDSFSAFASRLDRHANLGEGQIGESPLSTFLHQLHTLKPDCPVILEVPGSGEGPRKVDIDTARSLADN